MQKSLIDDIDNCIENVVDGAGYHMRCEGLLELIDSFVDNNRATVLKLNREQTTHLRSAERLCPPQVTRYAIEV